MFIIRIALDMTPRRYAIITFRSFAAYSAIISVVWIPWTYLAVSGKHGSESSPIFFWVSFCIAVIVPLLGATAIWDQAPSMADRLLAIDDEDDVPDEGEDDVEAAILERSELIGTDMVEPTSVSGHAAPVVADASSPGAASKRGRLANDEILGLAVMIIGLWAIVGGVSDLIDTLASAVRAILVFGFSLMFRQSYVYGYVARIVFGLVLVFKGRAITGAILRRSDAIA